MGRSHGYNPLAYIRDANDVLKLVTNLIRNTTPRAARATTLSGSGLKPPY